RPHARGGAGEARRGGRRDPPRHRRGSAADRMSAPDVYIGLMSGTSLDGISAAAARFRDRDAGYDVDLLAHVQLPYTEAQRTLLRGLLREGGAQEYCRANFDLGMWLAGAALAAIGKAGILAREIRAIGSHGHTIWHEPPHSTWQLGEIAVIAEHTQRDVVGDFRVADVAAGGQ